MSEIPDSGVPRTLAADMTIAEQQDWITGFLRRHVVSRRSALQGGGAALAALGLSANPFARSMARAYAADGVTVVGRRLSYGSDPTTQMRLAGELTGAPAGAVVADLGTTTAYGTELSCDVRRLLSQIPSSGTVVTGAEQFFVHASADGLTPGTTYHYRFRLADGTVTPDATFTTAPSRTGVFPPFRFTALGDHGTDQQDPRSRRDVRNSYQADDTRRSMAPGPNPASALVGLIAQKQPAFHLLAGGICYADPQGLGVPETFDTTAPGSNYDPFAWTTYFAQVERSASVTPWMFATGNHDMEALYGTPQNAAPRADTAHGYGGHLLRLDLPTNGPSGCPSVYSFVHGNVAVLSLDANDLSKEIPANTGYSGGAQVAWLTDRLAGFRADPTVDFIVAFFHHCAFSTSKTHASDGGVRDALAPLFDRFSVDLVVQAHNHQYERTNPIRRNTSTRQVPDFGSVRPAQDGTTYVLVGSGGRPRYPFQPGSQERYRGNVVGGPEVSNSYVWRAPGVDAGPRNPAVQEPESVDWSQVRYDDYAFLTVDVEPAAPGQLTRMKVYATTDLGVEIDRITLERVAGAAAGPAPVVPEAPSALLLPAAGLAVAGGVAAWQHQRAGRSQIT